MSRTRLTARSRADLVVTRRDDARRMTTWRYRGRVLGWASDMMRRVEPHRFEALRKAFADGRIVWKGEAERRRDERRYVSDTVDAMWMAVEQATAPTLDEPTVRNIEYALREAQRRGDPVGGAREAEQIARAATGDERWTFVLIEGGGAALVIPDTERSEAMA